MKKLLTIIFLFRLMHSQGQEQKTFTIGDTLPDYTFEKMVNYPTEKARLSDFKGKAILLDFWATWCSSCVANLPKLDSLQQKFNNQLQVIAVSHEKYSVLEEFYARKKKTGPLKLASASDTTAVLAIQLGRRFMPHYVWLDSNRVIQAITNAQSLTHSNVEKLVNGKKLNLPVKKDPPRIELDYEKPLFIDSNFVKAINIQYYSILTKNVPGLYGLQHTPKVYGRRIMATNHSISGLYAIAYGDGYRHHWFPYPRVIVTAKDSLKIRPLSDTDHDKYSYCYDLIIPEPDSTRLFKTMQADLNKLFGLKVSIEKKSMKCLVLKIIKHGKLKTNGTEIKEEADQFTVSYANQPLNTFTEFLLQYQYSSGFVAILDETGFVGNVDMEINADLKNLAALNKELHKYGLELLPQQKMIDSLILSDNGTKNKILME